MAKAERRIDKEELALRAMGISNVCYDESDNNKIYSVQFYDLDITEDIRNNLRNIIEFISEIFPYDLILYKTKHGIHFISFALLHGLRYTKAKSIKLSKELGNQDYWTEARDLTLRISPKWDLNHKVISEKPYYLGFLKKPSFHIISNKHLEFFYKFMALPKNVYNAYEFCDKRDYKIKIYHYKTRD